MVNKFVSFGTYRVEEAQQTEYQTYRQFLTQKVYHTQHLFWVLMVRFSGSEWTVTNYQFCLIFFTRVEKKMQKYVR